MSEVCKPPPAASGPALAASVLTRLRDEWAAVLQIEGKPYRIILASTSDRDIALRKLLRSTGIDETFLLSSDARVLAEIIKTGSLLEILGCALISSDFTALEWTPERAKETAHSLASIASDKGKQTLLGVAVLFVNAFLLGQLSG